ncbi:MAG: transcriptional regulator [Planctomycetota bacterium]
MGARARRSGKRNLEPGHFSYEGLDRVLHEKARLGILTALVTRPQGILFNHLKDLCALTDGNLSRHIQVLHDAELVDVWKGYQGRRPQTLICLSARGRREFVAYLEELERVIRDAKPEVRRAARGLSTPPGWVPA